jgi:radical SAM superfamily enzyme YgiQ (UPF0313 family)
MKVGVLEILALPSFTVTEHIFNRFVSKQCASLMPQAISVWCRQGGHQTFYATYYGFGDARKLLPSDLDIVFIACNTRTSPIAYALAKQYRRAGVQTVIGGAHAKAFPADCLRFFDLVVKECNQAVLADILAGHFKPGTYITSAKPVAEIPTVEERLPEIRTSVFFGQGKVKRLGMLPMLASTGCPYTCNFCVDWNNPYRLLSTDRLKVDLEYLAHHFPKVPLLFQDPNFAVKFDPVLEVIESIDPNVRPSYAIEIALKILNETRIRRLRDTNCFALAPGTESWSDYSNKVGVGKKTGFEKVNQVVEQFERLRGKIPYMQTGLIFGLDVDKGEEPMTLTKEFMKKTPYVWPMLNIPIPFGGTPLHDHYAAEGRILPDIPFSLYYPPYLTFIVKNYDPITYYEKLIELTAFPLSKDLRKCRLKSTSNWRTNLMYRIWLLSSRTQIKYYQQILKQLQSDTQFRDFHEGKSKKLPDFYHQEYKRLLGPYATALSLQERTPDLTQLEPVVYH